MSAVTQNKAFLIHAKIPFVVLWITVKIFAVMIYILLGSLAMHARGQRATLLWGLCAITMLLYIILLALTKHPLFFYHSHV